MNPRVSRGALWLGLLLAVAWLGACGRKGPVRPPEAVVPQKITDLTARNAANGVTLAWSRPTKYADGERMNDLGSFVVQRAAAGATSFTKLTTLPVTDRERFRQVKHFGYVDGDVVPGVSYLYRVLSRTVDDYVSDPSNVAAITFEPAPTPSPRPRTPKER